jgi:hypothetical protein
MVDPGVALQRVLVDAGGLRPSYLGPPESFHSRIPSEANQHSSVEQTPNL